MLKNKAKIFPPACRRYGVFMQIFWKEQPRLLQLQAQSNEDLELILELSFDPNAPLKAAAIGRVAPADLGFEWDGRSGVAWCGERDLVQNALVLDMEWLLYRKPTAPVQENFGGPTLAGQHRLVAALRDLDGAFGRAVRAARTAGEKKIFAELEAQWSAHEAFAHPLLSAQPALLLK